MPTIDQLADDVAQLRKQLSRMARGNAGAPVNGMPRLYAWPFTISALGVGDSITPDAVVNKPGTVTRFTNIGFRSSGPFSFQVNPSDLGGGLFNSAVDANSFTSLLDRPGLLPWPIEMRDAFQLQLTFTNTHTAAIDIRFDLIGIRYTGC